MPWKKMNKILKIMKQRDMLLRLNGVNPQPMVSKIRIVLALLALLCSVKSYSQEKTAVPTREEILKEGEIKNGHQKKFRWGVSFQQYWSNIKGEQVEKSYFAKPSIGGSVRAEYYFNSFLGVGLSVGFQQRGAGIINQDITGGAFAHPWIFVDTPEGYRSGDPDSTHLERLRFTTIEVPLSLILRTPKDFLGMRFNLTAGPTFVHNVSVNQTYQSIVDGFHPYNWVTSNYIRNDLGYQITFGPSIDSGGGGKSMFQVHFVYTRGLKNIYAVGQGTGYSVTYGVRLAWLF